MNITIQGVDITLTEDQVRKLQSKLTPTPKEYLLDILSKPFEVKLTKGCITYYQDDQWIFQQDLKNKYLWCYYHKVWEVFEKEYSMCYQQIQALHKEVVGEALNCKDFTPSLPASYEYTW